ncbi:hypothetical protein ACN20G_28140 (plasmid) [Streptomyces sp. BI20]|uniref:hypothetical protein n=1 Tax=Streptomyces sp. BI20 TaxID=3403460 RepID=UPI003C737930
MPDFRVMFSAVKDNRPFDTLPVADLEFEQFIGKVPGLGCTIPITSRDIARRVRALVPGRTAVWVTGGGKVWWGGILWARVVKAPERGPITAHLGCSGFASYLYRLHTEGNARTEGDNMDVAVRMVRKAMAMEGANIEILIASYQRSGVHTGWNSWETDHKNWGESLDSIANELGGFEWYVEPYEDHVGGILRKRFVHAHPKINRGFHGTMSRPGNILSYTTADDASQLVNRVIATGSIPQRLDPSLTLTHIASAERDDQFNPGPYPRLSEGVEVQGELVDDDIGGIEQVQDLASTHLAANNHVNQPTSLVIRPDRRFTPDILGMNVWVRINDLWHDEYRELTRVIGWKINPAQRGRAETVTLYLEAEPHAPTADAGRSPRPGDHARTEGRRAGEGTVLLGEEAGEVDPTAGPAPA